MQEETSLVDRALTIAGRGRGTGGRLHPKTVKAYARAVEREGDGFRAWCRSRGRTAMPATSETLAEYAEYLLQLGYARSTVKGRLAAIKAVHRQSGAPVPDGVAAWFVLRGVDPTTSTRETPPLARRDALVAIADVCDTSTAAGARDLCLVTLAWDLLATVDELTALDIGHVRPSSRGLLARLGERDLEVYHDHRPVQICPVEATTRWLDVLASHGAEGGPLFRSIDKGGNIGGLARKGGTTGVDGRLNPRGVARIWSRLLVRAGVPPCTPRALRLGGAVDDVTHGGARVVDTLRRARWSPNTTGPLRMLVTAQTDAQLSAGEVADE